MSDELYASHREESKARREANRTYARQALELAKIPFNVNNGGAHLVVTVGRTHIDYWPGTGLWIVRKWDSMYAHSRGRGVHNLISRIRMYERTAPCPVSEPSVTLMQSSPDELVMKAAEFYDALRDMPDPWTPSSGSSC